MDGAVWFSTLDLRTWYHNIPIRESETDKTAFITQGVALGIKCYPLVAELRHQSSSG